MTNDQATRTDKPDRARVETLRAGVERLDGIVKKIDRLDSVVAQLAALAQPTTTEALIKRAQLLTERDKLRDQVLAEIIAHKGVL